MDHPAAPWTADLVAERLIEAFRAIPHHPVFSDRGHFRVVGVIGAGEALNWPSLYVADAQARRVLMTWARCRATGESVRDRYRGLGWPRSSTERRRRDALAAIVEGLNGALMGSRAP